MRFQKIKFRVHESDEIQTMEYSFNFAVSVTFSLCFSTLNATLILTILCYYHGRHIHEVPEEMNGMFLTKVHYPLFLESGRVYGQFCIETLHESRKQKSSGLFVRISTFT